MARRKTHEEFVQEVHELVGDEYSILGMYVNTHTQIAIRHEACGYEWGVIPKNFLKGTRCGKCMGNAKKTHEEFIREVKELVGDEYKVLGKYRNTNTKIAFYHNGCSQKFEITPCSFLYQKSRCFHCFGTPLKTTEQFKKDVYDLMGKEYEVLGEYIGNQIKIEMKHTYCNHIWSVRPNDILQGSRCPQCSHNLQKTSTVYKREVFELVGSEYEVLGEYTNALTKVKIKHTTCDNVFEMIPNAFLHGSRCPKCRESKGERRISDFLKENNIVFTPQYRFKDCTYKRELPFDFAIFDHKNELSMLIEYDGEQHYKPWRLSDSEAANKKLKDTQRNDEIKNNYCIQNNIYLKRIPYWEFNNIEEILINELIRYEGLTG